jgi:hypothetical protein
MEYEFRWLKKGVYCPPVLQYRTGKYETAEDYCKTLDIIDVVSKLVWSEWEDVPIVYEGEDN